ncbi:MAG: nicotinate-nucleotide adenylyltransferase [Neisseria sp.]|nr:nicotinate-nucleotide adenylyltransferase [Neisseria sp.]
MSSKFNKIGLFGGTFDPIHNGHLHIARSFADELNLDMVVFLPAGQPYHKNSTQTAAEHRLAMTELAIADDARFAVSDCDMVRSGATYTFDTVQIFRQQFAQSQLYCLIGMDSLLNLHTWKNWQTLVKQVRFAVAARAGDSLAKAPAALHAWLGQALPAGDVQMLNASVYDISSSEIREQAKQGKAIDAFVPSAVADYVRQHKLYR